VKPRIFKQGGNRNPGDRVTLALSRKEVTTLARAIAMAAEAGLPPNRMITIHWERAGVPPRQAAKATASYLTALRNAIGTHRFAYVWIRENDYGDGSKGDHVHILAHIPHGFDLGRKQRARINAITGKPYRQGVAHTARIGGTISASEANSDHYHANLAAVAEYVLKGGTMADTMAVGLGRWREGGRVIGKRSGSSLNLRKAAKSLRSPP